MKATTKIIYHRKERIASKYCILDVLFASRFLNTMMSFDFT